MVFAFSSAALAVDIENQDDTDHEVSVVIGEASPTTFVLKAGEVKTDICNGEACVLQLDGNAWEAEADEKVIVKDKKMQIETRG